MRSKILKFIIFIISSHLIFGNLIYGINSNIIDIFLHIFIILLSIGLLFIIDKDKKTELTYKSIYRISRILLTSKDPSELFKKLTMSLVDDVGFKMCWVGFLEGDNLIPKYYYGNGVNYAKTLFISINPDIIESKGPSATSVIENRSIVCQNIQKSNITNPWKTRAKLYGWNSSLSIPIKRNNEVIGVITIYSSNVDGFQKVIIDIICELINNIEICLKNFDNFKLFEKLFLENPNAIMITDKASNIININYKFSQITQYSKDEVIGKNPKILQSGQHSNKFYKNIWESIVNNQIWRGEIYNKRKDGEIYPEELTIISIKDSDDEVLNYMAVFHDITITKKQEAKLKYLAFHDELTGLYNRIYIQTNFKSFVDEAKTLAFIYIDIDRFKNVNDSFGHIIGDEILKQISERLIKNLKKQDIISRIGGDEFLAVISMKFNDNINVICKRLLLVLSEPYNNSIGANVRLTASIGVSIYGINGKSFLELLQFADQAMYKSKLLGKNKISFYNELTKDKNQKRIKIESIIKNSLSEMSIVYQPILDIKLNQITSCEALIRWESKTLGIIQPSEFIPIAEEIGMIWSIGDFVFNEVFKELSQIHNNVPNLSVGINISLKQFKLHDFITYISELLINYKIDPSWIYLEITEWSDTQEIQEVFEIIKNLLDIGIQVAVDDFGTGYSNLMCIYNWPISKVKIDKMFISNIESDHKSKTLCKSIIDTSKELKIITIAEGVESKEQLELLSEMGCDMIQGYYISKELSKDNLISFLTI